MSSLIYMGIYQNWQRYRLYRTTLALTYMLYLLQAMWLQFQRKILKEEIKSYKKRDKYCHKIHSTYIFTTSKPIFTNQGTLESPKWELFTYIWNVQK